jgi:hypothetical protein
MGQEIRPQHPHLKVITEAHGLPVTTEQVVAVLVRQVRIPLALPVTAVPERHHQLLVQA